MMTNNMSPERPDSAQSESAPPQQQMSVPGSPIALTPKQHAQSPISILLAVAQSTDDDLTSLSWLHEGDVLKDMNINTSPISSTTSTPIKNGVPFLFDHSSSNGDDSSTMSTASTYSTINSPIPKYHQTNGNNQNARPNSIPFDPLIHINSKPPYSFSSLIFMAIEDSKQKALPVKEIYAWILDHFPYFKNAPTGWKNSVRHNLSLNKCFQKVEKAPNLGKGSLWTVDPQYKPNLIQALNRSPFYPCSTLDPESYQHQSAMTTKPVITNNNNNNCEKPSNYRNPNLPNPELFPFLSKKLAANEVIEETQLKIKSEQEESLEAVDAATVMLSLKNATRIDGKQDLQQIITNSPSQDHTYSATDSGDNEDDDIPDEDEELQCRKNQILCSKIDFEDDEERKIKEGAETLLNLAGISTQKRQNSRVARNEPQHKIRRYNNNNKNNNCNSEDEKNITPFRPRLLRTKRKECLSPKILFNNNNNEDEWVNHRNELDLNHVR